MNLRGGVLELEWFKEEAEVQNFSRAGFGRYLELADEDADKLWQESRRNWSFMIPVEVKALDIELEEFDGQLGREELQRPAQRDRRHHTTLHVLLAKRRRSRTHGE